MRKFRFSKLVRDNIVGAIVANGNNPIWRTLQNDEYIYELKKKLAEEATELVGADSGETIKELADVQEIIDNLLKALKVSKKELAQAQKEKNNKNGSFRKRQYIDLVEVEDNASEIEYYLKFPNKYPEVK
ncbi:hypothetical protein A2801_02610 [Candidatus Woesebacteria bacterium RIFCSPHIGHO2_01_FULL_41_10]|uniref:NTP pyrophosphohydrolase MazG putative catalytic core domain-containing protein n=1 Tax=Candidatus Woesebacteria bacterium RIFCSPHIGHO2_01_FULL_41_10 TaxID=1802500 RepID=A0A1F7YNC1_9BACT|nr:MAG: hypothetical protein A2801_02610 [Candidatus Woesebacteria bacterium RIFCSPHIGHO2_01_FULL_41_10]